MEADPRLGRAPWYASRRHCLFASALVLLVGAVTTLLALLSLQAQVNADFEAQLRQAAERRVSTVVTDLFNNMDMVELVAKALEARFGVDAGRGDSSTDPLRILDDQVIFFKDHLTRIGHGAADISYLEYTPRALRGDFASRLLCVRGSDTLKEFNETVGGIDGDVANRKEYAWITTTGSWNSTNIRGLDLLSSSSRRGALVDSRACNCVSSSPPLTLLVTNPETEALEPKPGFLVAAPVFAPKGFRDSSPVSEAYNATLCGDTPGLNAVKRTAPVWAAVNETKNALRGWSVVIFVAERTIDLVRTRLASDTFSVLLEDVTETQWAAEMRQNGHVDPTATPRSRVLASHSHAFGEGQFLIATRDLTREEGAQGAGKTAIALDERRVGEGRLFFERVGASGARADLAWAKRERARTGANRLASFAFAGAGRVWNVAVVARAAFGDLTSAVTQALTVAVIVTIAVTTAVATAMLVAREQWLTRRNAEVAREEQEAAARGAHETTINYATHELRNPLQVVVGASSLAGDAVERARTAIALAEQEIGSLLHHHHLPEFDLPHTPLPESVSPLHRAALPSSLPATHRSLAEASKLLSQLGSDVSSISASARVMLILIQDLVDLQQLRDGELKLSPIAANVLELADTVTGPADLDEDSTNAPLHIVTPALLPPFVVIDPLRVEQAVRLLLESAKRYTRSVQGAEISFGVLTESWSVEKLNEETSQLRSTLGFVPTSQSTPPSCFSPPTPPTHPTHLPTPSNPSHPPFSTSAAPPKSSPTLPNPLRIEPADVRARLEMDAIHSFMFFKLGRDVDGNRREVGGAARGGTLPDPHPFGIVDLLLPAFPVPLLQEILRRKISHGHRRGRDVEGRGRGEGEGGGEGGGEGEGAAGAGVKAGEAVRKRSWSGSWSTRSAARTSRSDSHAREREGGAGGGGSGRGSGSGSGSGSGGGLREEDWNDAWAVAMAAAMNPRSVGNLTGMQRSLLQRVEEYAQEDPLSALTHGIRLLFSHLLRAPTPRPPLPPALSTAAPVTPSPHATGIPTIPMVVFRIVDNGIGLGGESHRTIFRQMGLYAASGGFRSPHTPPPPPSTSHLLSTPSTPSSSSDPSPTPLRVFFPACRSAYPTAPTPVARSPWHWTACDQRSRRKAVGKRWTLLEALPTRPSLERGVYVGRVQGSALGLATAARIVHAMGGVVRVFEAKDLSSGEILNVAEAAIPLVPPWHVLNKVEASALHAVGFELWERVADVAEHGNELASESGDEFSGLDGGLLPTPTSQRARLAHAHGASIAAAAAATGSPKQLARIQRPPIPTKTVPPQSSSLSPVPQHLHLSYVSAASTPPIPSPTAPTGPLQQTRKRAGSDSARPTPITSHFTPTATTLKRKSFTDSRALRAPPPQARRSSSAAADFAVAATPPAPPTKTHAKDGDAPSPQLDPKFQSHLASSLPASDISLPEQHVPSSSEGSAPKKSSIGARRMRSRARSDSAKAEAIKAALKDKRILVIDDERSIRQLLTRALEAASCHVVTLEDGDKVEEALRKSEEDGDGEGGGEEKEKKGSGAGNFDVILMDIVMNRSDGAEVTHHLVHDLKLTTPIIAVTSNTAAWDLKRFKAAGFTALARKPIDQTLLREVIATVLGEVSHPSHGAKACIFE